MFGLKLITEEDYSTLKQQLDYARELLAQKECDIRNLTRKIDELENEVQCLLKKVSDNTDAEKENKTILLTDVAEAPLKEEKPARRTRKVVKKPEGTTPRKKVVHKTEEE